MNDYVQRQWQGGIEMKPHGSKTARVLMPILGIAVVIAAAAYGFRDYWYPYISPYL